jgi:hypothetical protein
MRNVVTRDALRLITVTKTAMTATATGIVNKSDIAVSS